MIIGSCDTSRKVFIVAEIGNNHEGDFALAQEMIERAAVTGVDAVKFQTFIPENYVTSKNQERLEQLRRFLLSREQIFELATQAKTLDLIFFSTPFDIDSAYFLDKIQPVFKVASGDNNFFPLIETLACFRKPTLISTGLADLDLLDQHYELWRKKGSIENLAFLHCIASYPVPIEQANLGAITTLRKRYPEMTIGYSDHTLGIDAAPCAVAAGARIIEKHFTLNKQQSDFRDHQLSADPSEMHQLVQIVRKTETMLGSGEKEPQPCEDNLRIAIRRSIAAARDLPAGTTLKKSDLTWVRPGEGIPPGKENTLIGRSINRALSKGTIIALEMLAQP